MHLRSDSTLFNPLIFSILCVLCMYCTCCQWIEIHQDKLLLFAFISSAQEEDDLTAKVLEDPHQITFKILIQTQIQQGLQLRSTWHNYLKYETALGTILENKALQKKMQSPPYAHFGTWKKPYYMKFVLVGLYCGPLLTLNSHLHVHKPKMVVVETVLVIFV